MRLLRKLLTGFVRNGELRLYDATGALHSFGAPAKVDGETVKPVTLRLHVSISATKPATLLAGEPAIYG